MFNPGGCSSLVVLVTRGNTCFACVDHVTVVMTVMSLMLFKLQAGDYLKAALRCSCTFEGGGRSGGQVLPTEVSSRQEYVFEQSC